MVGGINEAYVGHVATSVHIFFHDGRSTHHHTGFVVGGDGVANIKFVRIVGRSAKVQARDVFHAIVAVIETVGAGKEVAIDGAARGFHVGAALHQLVFFT